MTRLRARRDGARALRRADAARNGRSSSPGSRRHLYDLVRDYPGRSGKGSARRCCWPPARRSAASLRDGLGPAVALELLHNAFLIHDDIEDDSERGGASRRCTSCTGARSPSTPGTRWPAWRSSRCATTAVLGARVAERVLAEFLAMVRQTTEGQALELGWRRDNVVDLEPADYLELVGQEDLLVHDRLPAAGGRARSARAARPPGGAQPFRVLPRRRLPDPRRPAQPRRHRRGSGQGAARRPARGQAHADAHPPSGPRDSGAPRLAGRLPRPCPRAGGPRPTWSMFSSSWRCTAASGSLWSTATGSPPRPWMRSIRPSPVFRRPRI